MARRKNTTPSRSSIISGRAVRAAVEEPGRFGRKNEVESLLAFVETALRFGRV